MSGLALGCAGTIAAIGFFESRSSANSMDFYRHDAFPTQYYNNLFVSIFGSFVKQNVQTGIKQVQLTPDGDSYQSEIDWFATWDGMPLGLIVSPEGYLYVGDYINSIIYRISYGLP